MDVGLAWEKLLEENIWYSENDQFLATNFVGSAHQIEHMDFIKAQADKHADGRRILLKMHAKGLLTDNYLSA